MIFINYKSILSDKIKTILKTCCVRKLIFNKDITSLKIN